MHCPGGGDPNERRIEAFEHLAAGKLPPGHPPREEWAKDFDYIAEDGTIRERYNVPLSVMPPSLQEFARELSSALYGGADTALSVLRWRSGVLGPPWPFAHRGMEWSFDGNEWHPMPSDTLLYVLEQDRLEVTEAAADQMQHLLGAEMGEPLAHSGGLEPALRQSTQLAAGWHDRA